MLMLKRWKKLGKAGLGVVAAAGALALVACGSPAGAGGGASGGDAAAPEATMKVAMITHSTPGDTFWDIMRKGAEAAGKKDGIEILYSSDPDGARQAQLVEQAIDQNVDGIILTLAKPDAMSTAVKKAVEADIPVFSVNAGEGASKELGALAHFGQDESVAGNAAGEKFNELGAKKVLCVIQEQGHVGLESRCAGVKETLQGEMEIIYVTAADVTNISSTITAKLQTDPTIDYVLTLGAPQAPVARDSIAEAGSAAKLATFDMNPDVAAGLSDGSIQFAVDQQPYLQGYAAVDGVWLYKNNLNVLGGGKPVLTGPAIITPDQAEQLTEFVDKGTR